MTPEQAEVLTRMRQTLAEVRRTIARFDAGETLPGAEAATAEIADGLRQLATEHEAYLQKHDPEGLTAAE